MSGSSVQILALAHAYIEAGNLEDAENLIRSLLEQDPDNTDAWWLLAHSVRDPHFAREALDQVLRLDPNDQQARSLLAALDERFPSEEQTGRRRRLSLPRLRVPRPRLPSISLRGGDGGYARPMSFTLVIVLLVIGGWLLLRNLGFELVLPTPAPDTTASNAAQVVATGEGPDAGTSELELQLSEGTSSPDAITGPIAASSSEGQVALSNEENAGAAESERTSPGEVVAEGTPAAAPATATTILFVAVQGTLDAAAGEGTPAGGEATPIEVIVSATATHVATLSPVPTYPYPTQTDAEEFAAQFVSDFAQAGLLLAYDSPLLEGSKFGSTALANVCLDARRGLRDTVNVSMEVMAGFATQLLNSAPALGVRIMDCQGEDAILRVIATTIDSAILWSEGSLELSAFQASWEAVG